MGNAASNANRPSAVRQTDGSRRQSQPPSSHPTSRLRTKKRSLELPDLASITTSAFSQAPLNSILSPHIPGYHRTPPPPSTPIPIPASSNPNLNGLRPQNHFNSTLQMSDVPNEPPSTHIAIHPPRQSRRASRGRGASRHTSPDRTSSSSCSRDRGRDRSPAFVPEVVQSTIPVALSKAEEDLNLDNTIPVPAGKRQYSGSEDPKPVSIKIIWTGGGKNVVLARAGDDNWKGRQPMEQESAYSSVWTAYVSLMPGTHHIKFIVDDQWRVADDLPTAVDDDGSLANYVAVPIGPTPPSRSPLILPTQPPPPAKPLAPGESFWSDSTSTSAGHDFRASSSLEVPRSVWTSKYPPELIAAAHEEEQYLASSSGSGASTVPAPNIPPAPILPRHLDKLILNVKPGSTICSHGSLTAMSTTRSRERDDRRGRRGRTHTVMGMTSDMNSRSIPVTTASGTSLAPPSNVDRGRLEVPALADDNSVLPVPSHVVLHHLSTSAIRNGMLAVATTTRYRQKYLTTIYYKPT